MAGCASDQVRLLRRSGEGEVVLLNPKAYTGKATINTEVEGKPERMDISQAGKWLSDDCGNIKPSRR